MLRLKSLMSGNRSGNEIYFNRVIISSLSEACKWQRVATMPVTNEASLIGNFQKALSRLLAKSTWSLLLALLAD